MNDVLKILWYGYPGHGIASASEIFAELVSGENKYTQSVTNSHLRKRGEPVTALNRVSDSPLRFPRRVTDGDVGILMEADLLFHDAIRNQLKEDALYIVNSGLALPALQEKYGLQENPLYVIDSGTITVGDSGPLLAAIPFITILMDHYGYFSIPLYKKGLLNILLNRMENERAELYIKTIEQVINEVQKSWE